MPVRSLLLAGACAVAVSGCAQLSSMTPGAMPEVPPATQPARPVQWVRDVHS